MKFKAENPAKMFLFKSSIVTFNHGEIETEDKDMIKLLSGMSGVKAAELPKQKVKHQKKKEVE